MGGSRYDEDADLARIATNKQKKTDDFDHHRKVKEGTSYGLHEKMDIRIKGKRESFDSPNHPISIPIVVMFDQTGSMGVVPRLLINKLPTIMGLLMKKGYLLNGDPQILYGCVGDARTIPAEKAPLQIGEFESGGEMVDSFKRMFLEGLGGRQMQESYDLALYCAARKFITHHNTKRNEKGFMFIIGDEMAYPTVEKKDVANHIGDNIDQDIPIKDIVKEASKKFEIFFIMPGGTYYWNEPKVDNFWKSLLGSERFIKVEDPALVAEVIATTIGTMEGVTMGDVKDDLKSYNVNDNDIKKITESLASLVPVGKPVVSSGNLPEVKNKPSGMKKL